MSEPRKRCPNCAWAIKRAETLQLSAGASWVLVVIAELVDGITLRRQMTQTELAARTRMTQRTVYQHVQALVKAKCLEIERTREGYHYHLLRRDDPPMRIEWPDMDEDIATPDPQIFPIPSPIVLEPDQQIFPVQPPQSEEIAPSKPEKSAGSNQQNLPIPILDSLKESPKEERTLLRNGGADEPRAVVTLNPDVRKQVWEEGKAILRKLTGKLDTPARRQIGVFLKTANDDCTVVLDVLRLAAKEGPYEPVPWVMAGIQARVRPAVKLSVHETIRREGNLPSFLGAFAPRPDSDDPPQQAQIASAVS